MDDRLKILLLEDIITDLWATDHVRNCRPMDCPGLKEHIALNFDILYREESYENSSEDRKAPGEGV